MRKRIVVPGQEQLYRVSKTSSMSLWPEDSLAESPAPLGSAASALQYSSGSHRFRIYFAFGELSEQGVDPFLFLKA